MKGRVSGKRRYGFGSVDPIKGDIPDIFNTRRPGAGSRSHFTASTSTAARAAPSRTPALLQHALLRRRLALAPHRLHRRPHLLRLPPVDVHAGERVPGQNYDCYAVRSGLKRGVFMNWKDVLAQTTGHKGKMQHEAANKCLGSTARPRSSSRRRRA